MAHMAAHRHFELVANSDGLFLRDSGATNKTFVNGEESARGV
jgi:pSer/pThr/pTyr-binding forkhead associated (FHA) protein